MSRLDLRFLGAPEARCGGQRLKFPTRKSLALLVYLAVAGGWHSREKLMALLWPESDTRRGQASLRNALARLRHALGEAGSHLLVEADRLSFDLRAGATADWQQLADAAEAQDAAALQRAVNLYRGDFLEGFSLPDAPAFDEWASLQREHWHRRLSNLLGRLCQWQIDTAQIKAGLDTAVRWTAHDPLNEAAHRRLIELHTLAGDRTAALQAYHTCRAILSAELAVEPSPETKALVEHLKAGEPGGSPSTGSGTGAAVMASPLPLSSAPLLPFVGRSIKHLQLVTAFHAARQGQTQLVLIEGEAGIGKTRLATEFLAWATTHQADVLAGRAFEAGGRLPYQPVVEALRPRVERENAPEDWLSDVWLAELGRLLPELHDRYPDLPPPVDDPNLARTRLPAAVARLGQALASRRRPLVIFIDDAQWADAASLDLLHYCSRAWAQASTPILLLLALRPESGPVTSTLNHWLANLERDLPVQRQQLAPLTLEETRQLAQALLNRDDPAGRAAAIRWGDWLFAQTGGQPFFINETIKELVGQGALQGQPDRQGRWALDIAALESWLDGHAGQTVTPAGARRLILSRLAPLTNPARSLLAAAAVLGRECSYTRLCHLAGLDEMAGLPALDELLAGHLLIETTQPDRPYALAHDKIREVIYAEASAARRRLLHQRAFELLEAAASPEPGQQAAELAYHALAARLTEPAFRYSLAAGDNALALFAARDAITYYEQARHQLAMADLQSFDFPLDLAQDRSPVPNLYLNLGRAYELAGDLKQAEAIYRELLQQAQTTGQTALTCTALNRLATVAVHAYNFETAVEYLQQALQLAAESHNTAGLAEAEWGLAQLYHHRFDFQRSLVHSERTLKLARQVGDERLVAGSLNALAYAHMLLGRVSEGETTMVEARTLYARSGNKALEADCLTAIAAAQIWQGRIRDGIETARAAEAMCANIENPWGHIYSRVWLATGLLDSGDYEAALAVARAGHNQARAHNLLPMSIFIALVLGKIYQTLGQWAAASEIHQAALALNEQAQSEIHAALIESELCAGCALAGNWAEATAHARQALAYRKYDVLPLVIPSRWLETEALLRGGEVELARQDARRWGDVIGRVPRFRVGHLRSLAVLDLTPLASPRMRGDRGGSGRGVRSAIAHLEEALALAEEIGLPGEQGQILAKLGEL